MKRSLVLYATLIFFVMTLLFSSVHVSRAVQGPPTSRCEECQAATEARFEQCQAVHGTDFLPCYDRFNQDIVNCFRNFCEQ